MKRSAKSGIGILSAIILIGMTAALIAASIPIVNQVAVAAKTLKTREDLEQLKTSLAGNPNLIIQLGRADFGYIGTIGDVPDSLEDLWVKGSQPEYDFDTTLLVGAGWIGPYPPVPFVEELVALDTDPFGNTFVYTNVPFNRVADGSEVAVRVLSKDPGGAEGTDDDMLIDVLSAEIFSRIEGTLVRNNQTVPFASVTLNVPVAGLVDQEFAITDENGDFTFDDVSYGFRSVAIDPRLTYEDGTAKLQGTRLKFTVTNFGANEVSITSMTATYATAPASYYEEVRIGNTEVFDYNTDNGGVRPGSGDTIVFSAETVPGSGKPNQVIPLRVEQEITSAPALEIQGVGQSIVVEIRDFKDAATGGASGVSVSGVTFVVNFSDGSQNTFTVP